MKELYRNIRRRLMGLTCWPKKHKWIFIHRSYGVWWECEVCYSPQPGSFEARPIA